MQRNKKISKNELEKNNIDLTNNNIKQYNDNLYDCKCEFFWKIYLKFEFDNEFDQDSKNEFNKCPAKCPFCEENNEKTYCILDLWHEYAKNDKTNKNKYWISKDGHKFTCKHPTPCHTIFLIDCSTSMDYNDICPNIEKIKNNPNFNNRLGLFINVIDNYSRKRNNLNEEDIFSIISFNSKSNIILTNYNLNNNLNEKDIIDECMSKIKIDKGTNFENAFIQASEILAKTNKQKYQPVIILLTDGDDCNKENTINFIKKVSYYLILFIYYS